MMHLPFSLSPRAQNLRERLLGFMAQHVEPNDRRHHDEAAVCDGSAPLPVVEELKAKAQGEGLWNLFLPESRRGAGLSNLEYAPLAEVMGRFVWASELFNSSPPDTGNMEVLERYANERQKAEWLEPLLRGEIRSCFMMTEPAVASSDATNVATRIERDGDHYTINGRKWWITNGCHPRARIAIVMGRTNPDAPSHQQQSMVLVPMATPGVVRTRPLTVFGYTHLPGGHAEFELQNVRVPVENLLLGEGRGFEIAQGRLGPGRIHHCMRAVGAAEHALELLCRRAEQRVAFGRRLAELGPVRQAIAHSRLEIDQTRLLVLHAAHRMDTVGNREARKEIAMIKVTAAQAALRVLDRAIQVHGGAGVSDDFQLASDWGNYRTLRIADGPDEVHLETVARLEIRDQLRRAPE